MSSEEAMDHELHGRLVIIGLALLDPYLRRQLESCGAFESLIKELREPLSDILTDKGLTLYELHQSVPICQDNALSEPVEDMLGRAPFARYLFARISMLPRDSAAYVIHLCGPWGSGKSTVMNFLRDELENSGEWSIVDYNAWQNQHIDPPWWSLMDTVFQKTKGKLALKDLIHEWCWRLGTGNMHYLVGGIVLVWVLAFIVIPLIGKKAPDTGYIPFLSGEFESIGKIFAFVVTIWGAIIGANRSLLLGSSQAAENYIKLTSDPMANIRNHFNRLIERIPQRVIILIDDLDRCQSEYVVKFLEAVQTTFRDANVVIVVAADYHWLNACYEEIYEKIGPKISVPGKPFGFFFLEKAFRFSTPMPGFPEDLKNEFWHDLLQAREKNRIDEMIDYRTKAKEVIASTSNEWEVNQAVERSEELPPAERRAIVEEAVVRLAAPDITMHLEHTLLPYKEFLEDNPRAMKRLVNSYSANRALALLSETKIDLHQLALWTIIQSRWPLLAEYLEEHSEMLSYISQQGDMSKVPPEVPESLKTLFVEPEVRNLVSGGSFHVPLEKSSIVSYSLIHAY